MVQVGESRVLVEELEKEGVQHIYLEIPTGQHGFETVPGTAGNLLTFYFVPRFIFSVLYG